MNIIEQIKALFSKKTWSSSDANVSAQKILLGDANAEPSGTIGMNDLASVLGVGSKNNATYFFNKPNDEDTGLKDYGIYIVQDWNSGSCTAYLVCFNSIVLLSHSGDATDVALTKRPNETVRITSTHRGGITTLL